MTYKELIADLMRHKNLDDEVIVTNEADYVEEWVDVRFEIETIICGDEIMIGVNPIL